MKLETFDDANYNTYHKNKINDNMKIRSHLVTERFLLTIVKVLSSDLFIQRRSLNNIRKFINAIDRKFYSNDIHIIGILLCIENFINVRMKTNSSDDVQTMIAKLDTLLIDNYEDLKNNLIIPTVQISKTENNETELDFVNETLEHNLKYNKIISRKDELSNLANEISACSYTETGAVMGKFRTLVSSLYEWFKDTDNEADVSDVIHTSDPSFVDYIRETYINIKNPKTALKTGIKAFNDMLGYRGGFLNGKYYMFYANTNTFKSALLLHISRWMRKYNSGTFKELIKKTGKIPTVLHVSLENSMDEDIERLYKTEIQSDINSFENENAVVEKWISAYEETSSEINISFVHGETNKYKVSDIDKMCDVLDEQGYKVISIVIDYIELIRAEDEDLRYETRLQLAKISERLLNLAKTRDVPVITAHQLNRAGGANLTAAKESGQQNAIMTLNNNFIGESYAIEKPVDFSAFIDLEYGQHDKDKKYLLLKRNKCRYSRFGKEMFVYEIHDGIILRDDIRSDKDMSMDSVPNQNGIVNTELQDRIVTTGNRGAYDIREKKEKVPLHTETVITPRENKGNGLEVVKLLLNNDNWYTFLDTEGFIEEFCISQDFDYSMSYEEIQSENETYYFMEE